MADLSINIEYSSKARLLARQVMKWTFPLWGLVPGLVLLWASGNLLLSLIIALPDAVRIAYVVNIIFAGLIIIASLLTIKFLEKSKILIDKNGLEFPLEVPLDTPISQYFKAGKKNREYISWKDVRRIFYDEGNRRLLVYDEAAAPTITIDLRRIQASELDQLLVSVDVFAPHTEQDLSVAELKNTLKQTIRLEAAVLKNTSGAALLPQADALSYTELWEEELTRRFRAAAFMPLEVGMILRQGTLTIVRHLALGGLSAVYLAQLKNNQLVTLKESVIPEDADSALKEKAREMFAREANFLIRLSHPNIVPVLDYFVEQERSYLMLDYMSGQDLRQYVKQNGAVRESLAIDWAGQIARVVQYLHEQQPPILHRDLTPDNLIVRADGQIVVIDFGAANEFLGNATGTFVGKQSYIAPEQFRGKATTASDIYAFGGTLYYLITGSDPEALSQSDAALIKEGLKPELVALIKACTAMEETDRPEHAGQIIEQLTNMSKAANTAAKVDNI